jgi:hypothetical protein
MQTKRGKWRLLQNDCLMIHWIILITASTPIAVGAAVSATSVTASHECECDCNHQYHHKEGQHVRFVETNAIVNTSPEHYSM